MKKIIILLFVIVILLPLSADSGYVYTGYGNVFPSNEASLPLDVNMKKIGTKVFYGFYSADGTVEKDSSDTTTYQLVFNESIISIDGDKITYKATANIKGYIYILSNTGYTLSLKWTHLSGSFEWNRNYEDYDYTYTFDEEGTIPVNIVINGTSYKSTETSISSATEHEIYKFDPSSGVLAHSNFDFTATTDSYTNEYEYYDETYTITSYDNYTGTMTLTLKATS